MGDWASQFKVLLFFSFFWCAGTRLWECIFRDNDNVKYVSSNIKLWIGLKMYSKTTKQILHAEVTLNGDFAAI